MKEFIAQRPFYTTNKEQSTPGLSQIIHKQREGTKGIGNHINGQDITLAIMIVSVGTESSKILARHRNFNL